MYFLISIGSCKAKYMIFSFIFGGMKLLEPRCYFKSEIEWIPWSVKLAASDSQIWFSAIRDRDSAAVAHSESLISARILFATGAQFCLDCARTGRLNAARSSDLSSKPHHTFHEVLIITFMTHAISKIQGLPNYVSRRMMNHTKASCPANYFENTAFNERLLQN